MSTEDILQPARKFNLKSTLLLNYLRSVLPTLRKNAETQTDAREETMRLLNGLEAKMTDAVQAHIEAGGGEL